MINRDSLVTRERNSNRKRNERKRNVWCMWWEMAQKVSERKELLQGHGLGLEMEFLSQGSGNQQYSSRYLEQQKTECRPWELAAGVAGLEEQGQGHNWTPESKALPRVWSRVQGASVTATSGATAVATHAPGSWRLGSEQSIREQVLPTEALCEALMREEAAISSLNSWADPYESSLLWGGGGLSS